MKVKKKNEIVKLTDGIYQIRYYWLGAADVYAYLVVGEQRALLIDTCYSTTRIRSYVEQVTKLPVDVVNTHGHFDHIGGNAEFERIYLSEKDWKTAKEHSEYSFLKNLIGEMLQQNALLRFLMKFRKFRRQVEETILISPVKYRKLPDCGYFELGDRKVSFIETPGHTQGSICLFDEKSKYFFVGDMACEEGVLLGFDHSTSVEKYLESVRRMLDFYEANEGRAVMPSHHRMPEGKDIFERYISICEDIVAGKLAGEHQSKEADSEYCVKRDGLQVVYRSIRKMKEYAGEKQNEKKENS